MARRPLTPDAVRRAIAAYLQQRKACRRGHDVTEDGALVIDSQGSVRCTACIELRRDSSRIAAQQRREAATTCKRGHPWRPETTRTTVRAGHTVRHCTVCDQQDGARGGHPRGMTPKAAEAFLALCEARDRCLNHRDREELDARIAALRPDRRLPAPQRMAE